MSKEKSTNWMDPIVRHDPTVGKVPVFKLNKTDQLKDGVGITASEVDSKKIDGPKVPIVRIDTQVMSPERIQKVHLDYKGFVPTCEVVVSQTDGKDIERMESAGMHSTMTIIMTPQIDGAYKPISVNFYITEAKYEGTNITYRGTFLLNKLEVPVTKQIKFQECNGKQCGVKENKYPNTFEFLHEIAVKECGLGFATTDKVKEINDERVRLVRNEKYIDAIQKHIAFGGVDADSVFDGWIDLYRYLVVVNFSWVMSETMSPSDMTTKPVVGPEVTSALMPDQVQADDVSRLITNSKKMNCDSDLRIESYSWDVSNESMYNNGNIANYYIGSPSGANNGNNSVEQSSIFMTDNSERSDFSIARFGKTEFCGYEYADKEDHNTPVLMQKRIHDNVLMKYKAKRLVVTMTKPNFGLQRGTIISVAVFEYDQINKRSMWKNMMNLAGDDSPDAYPTDKETEGILNDASAGLIDLAVSGMYYIDGMEFDYVNDSHGSRNPEIVQKLFLIKKGIMTNYSNFVSVPKSYH